MCFVIHEFYVTFSDNNIHSSPSTHQSTKPQSSIFNHLKSIQHKPNSTMSSREAYQLPSQRDNTNAYSNFAAGSTAGTGSDGPVVSYLCGECNAKVELARGTAIRCTTCGHRVLYKERTKRMVQFEAR